MAIGKTVLGGSDVGKYVCSECGYEKQTMLGIKNCPKCDSEGTMVREDED
jgi:rubrerythrin